MTLKRYVYGWVGMDPDANGEWCEYEVAQSEINTLKELIVKYVDVDDVSVDDFELVQNIFLEHYKED